MSATQNRTLKSSRKRLHIERLEDRLLMDGAGFVHTNPEPDPDSIVGVAGIEAQDDYIKASLGTQQLRIDVLSNDPLPDEAKSLRIKSVSKTAKGATVSISDDGKRIVYTPPEGGITFDSFYYIVEDDTGELGKANVTVGEKYASRSRWYGGGGSYRRSNDYFTAYEDDIEQQIHVLRNDGWTFRKGEIIEVAALSGIGGDIRIAEDGKSLFYRPPSATLGSDRFEYTVQDREGNTATHQVSIEVKKPYSIVHDEFRFDIGTGQQTLDLLANDGKFTSHLQTPRIVSFESDLPDFFQVSNDGQRVVFSPDEGFLGSIKFSYEVRYGTLEYQTVSHPSYYRASFVRVDNTFHAVDNWFAVSPNSEAQQLDVLANDPTLRRREVHNLWTGHLGGKFLPDVTLDIVSISDGNHGGIATVSQDGQSISYVPAAGFTGDETFSYTVEDSIGHRDSATVTVHVAEPSVDPTGVPKFILPGELEQFLIDKAVERFKGAFGLTSPQYFRLNNLLSPSWNYLSAGQVVGFDGDASLSGIGIRDSLNEAHPDIAGNASLNVDHSNTNTQEVDVDEADIVETDGNYVYTFSNGKLVIVNVEDPGNPELVSFTTFDDRYEEMYLQGDRITLIHRGSGKHNPAIVTVLDITDRAEPIIAERTEIAGRIVDTRATGDRVFVAVSGLDLPPLESTVIQPAGEGKFHEHRTNETLDAYVARLRDSQLEIALPTFRTYDTAGALIASGLLTDPTQIHKPIDSADDALLSLATFDVGDGHGGPDGATGIFASRASEVYMSGSSFYVLQNDAGGTTIFKFAIDDDGEAALTATGKVAGTLLNQFSVDEHEGRLRIATTETRLETIENRWGRTVTRQQRRFNNLLVLEQDGAELKVVGKIENLAPTETIKSVRFLDDRAYVTTFRVIDPLFAVDLSNPTNPEVTGALKIPGFSDYLHPVGENYVIGIGRDADEITGRLGPLQISLFYIGEAVDPVLVDQVTMEGAQWHSTEAWNDHHAVAYFTEDQVLTIPVSWSESIKKDMDGDGIAEWWGTENHSAIWAFGIDVDGQGGGSLDIAGSVEHASESSSRWSSRFFRNTRSNQARRSVRVGDALITLSDDHLKINRLDDVSVQLSEVYLGTLPRNDEFTIEEDSQAVEFDVRANDRLGVGAEAPRIVGVSQPTSGFRPWGWLGTIDDTTDSIGGSFTPYYGPTGPAEPVGTVEIAEDGTSLIFTPRENFFGTATFTYTVFDELRGEQQATVTVHVTGTPDPVDAIDDEFKVAPDSESNTLNILANDLNPDGQGFYHRPFITLANTDVDFIGITNVWNPPSVNGLNITSIGTTDHGGVVEINQWGTGLTYTPAADFVGIETFTYTVTNRQGETDVASVTVRVGDTTDDDAAAAIINVSETTAEQAFVVPSHVEHSSASNSIELSRQDREASFDSGLSELESVLLSADRPQYRPSISAISLADERAWDSEDETLCDVCSLIDADIIELLALEIVSSPVGSR